MKEYCIKCHHLMKDHVISKDYDAGEQPYQYEECLIDSCECE